MNPYPIDSDWFEHFREEAALPKALVWEDHFEVRLRAMGIYSDFMQENEVFIKDLKRTGKLEAAVKLFNANAEEAGQLFGFGRHLASPC